MAATIPDKLRDILAGMDNPAIAFSGGTDSSYLLYAVNECCDRFRAYSVESPFRSPVERSNAARISGMLGIPVETIRGNPLGSPEVASNGPDRCYHCKRSVFSSIVGRAASDGCTAVCDATNASDDPASRPGMRALEEMGVLSPLRDAGLTKTEIRALSKAAGLPCWNTPSDSCLATRVATGTPITANVLEMTAEAEDELRRLGFSGIRVRYRADGTTTLEVPAEQTGLADSLREEIDAVLVPGYGSYTVTERTSGD